MFLQDFKRNLRKTNGSGDFKASMLEEVYHAIRYNGRIILQEAIRYTDNDFSRMVNKMLFCASSTWYFKRGAGGEALGQGLDSPEKWARK